MLIYDIKPTLKKLELAEVDGVLMWNNANIEAQRIIDLRYSTRAIKDGQDKKWLKYTI